MSTTRQIMRLPHPPADPLRDGEGVEAAGVDRRPRVQRQRQAQDKGLRAQIHVQVRRRVRPRPQRYQRILAEAREVMCLCSIHFCHFLISCDKHLQLVWVCWEFKWNFDYT